MLNGISLKTRFAVVGTLLFVAVAWIPLRYAMVTLRANTEEVLVAEHVDDVQHVANGIGNSTGMRIAVIQSVAHGIRPEWMANAAELDIHLRNHKDVLTLFSLGMKVIDLKGRVISDYPAIPGRRGADMNIHPFFRQVLDSKEVAISPPQRGRFTGLPILDIAVPILDEHGKAIGVIAGTMNLLEDRMIDAQPEPASNGSQYFVLANSEQQFVSASDKAWVTQLPAPEILDMLEQANRHRDVYTKRDFAWRGGDSISSALSVAGTPWTVVGVRQREIAFGPIKSLENQLLSLGLLLTGGLIGGAWVLSSAFLKPLNRLTRKLEESSQEIQRITPLRLGGPAEIRQIITSYNRLAETIAKQTLRLKEDTERFRVLTDSAPIHILFSDANGTLAWVNSTWSQFTGISREDAINGAFADAFHPDEREKVLKRRKSYHDARLTFEAEYRICRSDGVYRWMNSRTTPVYSSDGVYLGDVTSCIDATDRIVDAEEQKRLLAENRELVRNVFRVIEDERQKIARDLHDDVGQWIAAIRANATTVKLTLPDGGNQVIIHALNAIEECASSLHLSVRRILRDLHPSHMDELELAEGLNEYIQHWERTFTNLRCRFVAYDDIPETGIQLRTTFYRVLQESLTNVARHARATEVSVRLTCTSGLLPGEEAIELTIEDNGIGFSADRVESHGLGLVGIRERIVAIGGTYQVRSLPGRGTTIQVTVPIQINLIATEN